MKNYYEDFGDFIVIKRGNLAKDLAPIDCPVCTCVVRDEIDVTSISRTGCCFDCENEVADPNRERWLDGWRPAEKDLDAIRIKRLSSAHSRRHN